MFALNVVIQIKNKLIEQDYYEEKLIDLAKELPNYQLLLTIPGIANNLASRIIAELGELNRFSNARQVVAYAGIDPNIYQSGENTGMHLRITKKGNKNLRCLLYLAVGNTIKGKNKLSEYYYKKMKQFFTNYTYDINFCFNSSRSVLQAYCDNKFSDLSNVYGNFRRLNKKDAMNILFDFFDSMGDKYYKFFKSLVDNKQIEMGYVGDYSNMAETTWLNCLNKSYVCCSSSTYNFYSLISLVHEVGHAYEASVVNNKNNKSFSTLFYEVSSCFFEYLFLRYVNDRRILVNDGKILEFDFLYDIYYFFFQNVLVQSLGNIFILDDYNLTIDFFTKKKLVDELNRKYNSNIQLDDNPINVRDALIYGYGRLIGINIYDRYVDDKKDILKRFDNFMNQYTLVGTFDSIDVLGISKDDLISNKALKRTLKEYKIKYDDYIVRNRK